MKQAFLLAFSLVLLVFGVADFSTYINADKDNPADEAKRELVGKPISAYYANGCQVILSVVRTETADAVTHTLKVMTINSTGSDCESTFPLTIFAFSENNIGARVTPPPKVVCLKDIAFRAKANTIDSSDIVMSTVEKKKAEGAAKPDAEDDTDVYSYTLSHVNAVTKKSTRLYFFSSPEIAEFNFAGDKLAAAKTGNEAVALAGK